MVPEQKSRELIIAAQEKHYKVMWIYCGFAETVSEMYDKPYRLCKWWVREHNNDSQYARGKFKIVSITHTSKLS
jgi:hypothetical protein